MLRVYIHISVERCRGFKRRSHRT